MSSYELIDGIYYKKKGIQERIRVPSEGTSESPSILAGFPVRTQDWCSICLSGPAKKAVVIPCHHGFHQTCLKDWFHRYQQNSCPLCRQPVDLCLWIASEAARIPEN